MRKRSPRSHLYTVVALILGLGLAGIWLLQSGPSEVPVASEPSDQTVPRPLVIDTASDLSQLFSDPGNIGLQSSAPGLQPASGAGTYTGFESTQATHQPQAAE